MNFDALSPTEGFLELLVTVSLRLASASDDELDGAIDGTLGAIATASEADRAYVTLFEGEYFTNSHEWVANGVAPHREAIVRMKLSDFPWSVALTRQGEVWRCNDVESLPVAASSERESFGRFGVKSVLQIPMRVGGRQLGVLGFNHVLSHRDWTDETVERLRALGDAIGMALARRDATLRIRAALDAAERANQAKDAFLSKVSHELRTPLHAILGFAELLDTPDRPAAELMAVQQIVGSGQQLLGLVEEMLVEADRRSTAQPPIE